MTLSNFHAWFAEFFKEFLFLFIKKFFRLAKNFCFSFRLHRLARLQWNFCELLRSKLSHKICIRVLVFSTPAALMEQVGLRKFFLIKTTFVPGYHNFPLNHAKTSSITGNFKPLLFINIVAYGIKLAFDTSRTLLVLKAKLMISAW